MEPRPVSRLASAISVGSLCQTLSALQALDIVDVAHTQRLTKTKEQQATSGHQEALTRLLTYTIPITLVSQAVQTKSPLTPILSTLRANLRLLPALSASPRALDHLLAVHCDGDDLDSVSMEVAQRAACQLDELIDAWNTLAPSDLSVAEACDLPTAVGNLRTRIIRSQRRLVDVDAAITLTRRTAVAMLHSATHEAVQCTEGDTKERARADGSLIAKIDMLDFRNRAISAKMRLIKAEVSVMTYSEGSVFALKEISTAVTRRSLRVQQELETKLARLKQYRALGKEFELVVEEFVRVRDKLEHLTWSKRELGIG